MAYIDHQIRKLPYNIHRQLAQYLDPPGESDWRALVAAMPDDTYSLAQVNNLERIANQPNGSPTQHILRDMGQKLKTVRQLVSYLDRIHNDEAMLLLRPHESVVITEHPQPVRQFAGNMAVLHCQASGFPTPRYQWYKNDFAIEHAVDHELRLDQLALSDEGVYKCCVSNRVNTEETYPVAVEVIPSGNAANAIGGPLLSQTATAKVALVIGNKDYMNIATGEEPLQHTINDSRDLAGILQGEKMQFKVISLANLKQEETKKAIDVFCDMLDEGAYAFFYFAGHGFQSDGRTYMVPIDAHSNWAVKECVSLDYLLQKVSERQPRFCLCVLDMCRKRGCDQPEINKDNEYWPHDLNLVVAYATCPLCEAFERRGDDNGLYMKYLKEHIEDYDKVEDVLQIVHQGIRSEVANDKETYKMRPELRTQTDDNFCLLDPIEQSVVYAKDIERDELFLSLHKIPRPKIINFEGGIKVQVGFDHSYGLTNYLCIYVHVIDVGQSTNCDALINSPLPKGLIDKFPLDPEVWNLVNMIAPNAQMSGSVLPRSGPFSVPQNHQPKSLPYCRVTQLYNIQRLSNNFSITVRVDAVLQGYNKKMYRPETFILKDFGISSRFS